MGHRQDWGLIWLEEGLQRNGAEKQREREEGERRREGWGGGEGERGREQRMRRKRFRARETKTCGKERQQTGEDRGRKAWRNSGTGRWGQGDRGLGER